jgi:hypothetical protein
VARKRGLNSLGSPAGDSAFDRQVDTTLPSLPENRNQRQESCASRPGSSESEDYRDDSYEAQCDHCVSSEEEEEEGRDEQKDEEEERDEQEQEEEDRDEQEKEESNDDTAEEQESDDEKHVEEQESVKGKQATSAEEQVSNLLKMASSVL